MRDGVTTKQESDALKRGSSVEVVECASVEKVSVKDASPPRPPLHFLVELLSTWDPSSLTRGPPHAPWCLNHWTTREVPGHSSF